MNKMVAILKMLAIFKINEGQCLWFVSGHNTYNTFSFYLSWRENDSFVGVKIWLNWSGLIAGVVVDLNIIQGIKIQQILANNIKIRPLRPKKLQMVPLLIEGKKKNNKKK